jgi:plastocyanin
MRNTDKEIIIKLRRLLTVTVGSLASGLFSFIVFTQLAAHVTHVHAVSADASPKATVQRSAAAPAESGAKVSIVNFAFTPEEIKIKTGETVTWLNDDGAPHGLKFDDGAKGTDVFLPGATFSRRFDRAGAYNYSCSVHPYMTGRVVVADK